MFDDTYLMIIFMVLSSYFIMSTVMLTGANGIFNHINKVYMALLMGSLMAFINFLIMVYIKPTKNHIIGLILSILAIIIFIILLRRQIFVDDNEFLKGMIEHHDMAILMATKISEKTQNIEIKNMADKIIIDQQEEIHHMASML